MQLMYSRVILRAIFSLSAILCVLAANPAAAWAEEDAAVEPAYRMAYQGAMKCFITNGVLVDDARDAKNAAKVAAFDAKAHESFDLAHLAGHRLGLSQANVNADIKAVQDRELPKLMRDGDYFRKSVAACRALGLM